MSETAQSEKKLPIVFLESMKSQLGDELSDFIRSQNTLSPISLRYNSIKSQEVSSASFEAVGVVSWCNTGYFLESKPEYIKDPLYHAGMYYPQEPSSMILSQLIDTSEPLIVLDMCAAPGGKTLVLADYLHPESLIVANEYDGKRVGMIVENAIRWGRDNIVVTQNRASDFGSEALREEFDLVLVDAPCSGEGMFRKDDFAISQWSPKLISQCVARQKDILFYSLNALRVGGTLIYSTCTYNPQENEEIVQWLISEFGLQIQTFEFATEWGVTSTIEGCYHCYPHKCAGEGLFFALLTKPEETPNVIESHGQKNTYFKQRTTQYKELNQVKKTEYLDVLNAWTKCGSTHTTYQVENEFYMCQARHFDTLKMIHDELHIKKYSLALGEKVAGAGFGFVPNHELALSMNISKVGDVFGNVDLSLADSLKYLSKAEIDTKTMTNISKGYQLICYMGMAIGWGKYADNRFQNLLPKRFAVRKS
jgi:16S rRNA C967 or C1407 C5-methylase (RsmB/RsmF family)/NOL1/NOP2/fmu family ribosome biogenesis protein